MGTHTFSKIPRKCLQILSVRKIMAIVFWDAKGVILVDFLERGPTINTERGGAVLIGLLLVVLYYMFCSPSCPDRSDPESDKTPIVMQ
ncbi:hypothetical protein J6590_106453 [Homalodisca vitripennis]|nr:hypothetical protein J6590_106453 [Homalodisca vitripennis]